MKALNIALLLMGCSLLAYAQTGYTYSYTPVSPAAESLMKQVISPVSYCTGTLEPSIPLFEIQTKDLTLPIVLKCNTSGIKVTDRNGIVGVGWELDYGPSIGRQIQGLADDMPQKGYLNYNSRFGSYDIEYRMDVMNQQYDEQPDIFFYSTLDESGRFVFRRPRSVSDQGSLVPIPIPITGVKVEPQSASFDGGFTLKDLKGNVYDFGSDSDSQETSYGVVNSITGWKVKSISSINCDCISFDYQTYGQVSETYSDTYMVEDQNSIYGTEPYNGYWKAVDGRMNFYVYEGARSNGTDLIGNFQLSSNAAFRDKYYPSKSTTRITALRPTIIRFANGEVHFTYNIRNLLTEMEVYEQGTCLQKITFAYASNTYGGFDRALLSTLTFTDQLTGETKTYSMSYYSLGGSCGPTCKAIDWCGYYNGHWENTDFVPKQRLEFYDPIQRNPVYAEVGGADRTSNLNARDWTIHSIRYPNGEREEFEYGLNQCLSENDTVVTPGIRIERIMTYDVYNQMKSDRRISYELSSANSSFAVPNFVIEQQKFYTDYQFTTISARLRTVQSIPVANPYASCNIPTVYKSVWERDDLDEDSSLGHHQRFNVDACLFPTGFDYLILNTQEDYQGKEVLLDGYCTMPYGNLLERSTEYKYTRIHTSGIQATAVRELFPMSVVEVLGRQPSRSEMEGLYLFSELTYSLDSKARTVLERTLEDRRESGEKFMTEYTYSTSDAGVRAGNPVKVSKTNSDYSMESTSYTYPYDYNTDVAEYMMEANDVTKPFSITQQKGEVPTEAIRFDYTAGVACASARLSDIYQLDNRGGSPCLLESYTGHDDGGNICELYKQDGTPVTLLWGYNYQKLVGVIEGADYGSVITRMTCSYEALQQASDDSLLTVLDALRNGLPNAQVTGYLHAPLRGITCIVSPNGNKYTYGYNGFGYLTECRDYDEAIIQYNHYHYR